MPPRFPCPLPVAGTVNVEWTKNSTCSDCYELLSWCHEKAEESLLFMLSAGTRRCALPCLFKAHRASWPLTCLMPVQLSQIYPVGTVHPMAEMDTRAERVLMANMMWKHGAGVLFFFFLECFFFFLKRLQVFFSLFLHLLNKSAFQTGILRFANWFRFYVQNRSSFCRL